MKMLEDLEEVVRLRDAGFDYAHVSHKAYDCVLTHHATIADMAKQLLEIQAENSMLHARMEAAERDAARYRSARNANPDDNVPYIAIERQDSWGKWRTDCLCGSDADAAIDQAMQETGR